MLTVTNNQFIQNAVITTPVRDDYFSQFNIQHFDNDGFQLNKLEQLYYEAAGIKTQECLGVVAAQYDWCNIDHPNFILDHSFVVTRCKYEGDALEQLKEHSKKFPYLNKYLNIKPKWGLDFALEFCDNRGYLEVLHIELDYHDLEIAKQQKKLLEQSLQKTNWAELVDTLHSTHLSWQNLQGMKRNDYKAQLWGMSQAETTLKVF